MIHGINIALLYFFLGDINFTAEIYMCYKKVATTYINKSNIKKDKTLDGAWKHTKRPIIDAFRYGTFCQTNHLYDKLLQKKENESLIHLGVVPARLMSPIIC